MARAVWRRFDASYSKSRAPNPKAHGLSSRDPTLFWSAPLAFTESIRAGPECTTLSIYNDAQAQDFDLEFPLFQSFCSCYTLEFYHSPGKSQALVVILPSIQRFSFTALQTYSQRPLHVSPQSLMSFFSSCSQGLTFFKASAPSAPLSGQIGENLTFLSHIISPP